MVLELKITTTLPVDRVKKSLDDFVKKSQERTHDNALSTWKAGKKGEYFMYIYYSPQNPVADWTVKKGFEAGFRQEDKTAKVEIIKEAKKGEKK